MRSKVVILTLEESQDKVERAVILNARKNLKPYRNDPDMLGGDPSLPQDDMLEDDNLEVVN